MPRATLFIDVVASPAGPNELWGPLGPLVEARTLAIELESGAPSHRDLWTGLGKLSLVVASEWDAIRKDQRKYPMLLFLSAKRPQWLDRPEAGFGPAEWQGVYRMRSPHPADVVLVHLRGLPDEPGFSLLRFLLTPRNDADAEAAIARLLADPAVLQSTKDSLLEDIMEHRIPATEPERRLSAKVLRAEGEREALLRVARHRCSPEALRDLEAITDLAELERQVTALLDLH